MPGSAAGFDLQFWVSLAFLLLIFIMGLAVGAYFWFVGYKNRDREKRSIDSVLLQIAVPHANEIKIDAMEQLFAALYGVY